MKGVLIGDNDKPLSYESFVQCPLGPMDRIHNYILHWEAMALYQRTFSKGDNVSSLFYATNMLTF